MLTIRCWRIPPAWHLPPPLPLLASTVIDAIDHCETNRDPADLPQSRSPRPPGGACERPCNETGSDGVRYLIDVIDEGQMTKTK